MANCQDVYGFLSGIRGRNLTVQLPDADVATLGNLHLVQTLTADQFAQVTRDVQALGASRQAISEEAARRSQLSAEVQDEDRRSHSILFHFEGQDKRAAQQQKEAQDEAALKSTDADLLAREQAFNELVAKQSLLDTLCPYGAGYIALTGLGSLQLRDLGIRLYRVSDVDFSTYWQQTQQVEGELNDIAGRGTEYIAALSGPLGTVDRSYLWAISIGLAKLEATVSTGSANFVDGYTRLGPMSHNEENRLMSAEMLCALRHSIADSLPLLTQLDRQVQEAGVPREASLGVASMLLLGQREDGTFATSNLSSFLRVTRSFESAALLAIINRPFEELADKFGALRGMFQGWGYEPSEDVELSSAYLTLSDLPVQGVNTKLAIIAKGMGAYLQYPLVAASILASIPVMEANETLNLLEHAYDIIGRRAMPLSQPELICLAVRMIHGIRTETVSDLDTTATAQPLPGGVGYGYGLGPRFFFVPIIVTHGAYYSTFSGVGGIHPAHAHVGGGFVG